jgi:ribosomal protein S18 acetylase RimI-like enzyme
MAARAARSSDAAEVIRLAGIMFTSIGQDIQSGDWATLATRAFLDRIGRDAEVFVVDENGGGLVACAAGTIATRLPGPRNPSGRVGYVQWVATDPFHRRRGHGRAVMTALMDWYGAKQVHVVELHATPLGEPLYRSLGFTVEGAVAMRQIR